MGLRLAVGQRQPMLAGLAEEVIDRLLGLRGDGPVFQEEAAAVEIKRDRRAEVIVVLVAVAEDLAVDLVDPAVQPGQRLEGRLHVELHAQVPQAAETGGDVERDVIVRRAAGEPRPGPVLILAFGQFLQRPGRLVVEPVVLEEDAHVPPGLALGLGLADPGRFLQQDRLEVLVLLQRAVQGGRAPPLLEDAMDLRIAVGDVPGQGVGIQPIERLLVALVGILHQVGQGHDRVPRRVRDHLHRQALALQGLRLARFQQPLELELLGLRAADRQRQRFGDQRAADQHRQQALLAVGDPAGRADGLVADRPAGRHVGHGQPPGEAPRLLGRQVEALIGRRIAQVGVDRFAGAGVGRSSAAPCRSAGSPTGW